MSKEEREACKRVLHRAVTATSFRRKRRRKNEYNEAQPCEADRVAICTSNACAFINLVGARKEPDGRSSIASSTVRRFRLVTSTTHAVSGQLRTTADEPIFFFFFINFSFTIRLSIFTPYTFIDS